MMVFYSLNPKRVQRYQAFIEEAKKQDVNHTSQDGWIYGNYMAKAISACFSKNAKYPTEPTVFFPDEPEEEFKISDADRFWAFAQMFNKSHFKDSAKEEASANIDGVTE